MGKEEEDEEEGEGEGCVCMCETFSFLFLFFACCLDGGGSRWIEVWEHGVWAMMCGHMGWMANTFFFFPEEFLLMCVGSKFAKGEQAQDEEGGSYKFHSK